MRQGIPPANKDALLAGGARGDRARRRPPRRRAVALGRLVVQLAQALARVDARGLLAGDGEVIRAAHYVIPEPYMANVVPLGNKRPAAASKYGSSQPRPSRSGTRNKAQHKAKSAGGKARFHRADIAEAVACQR